MIYNSVLFFSLNWQIKMIRKKSQFNADLYLSSIIIATETTPHSQLNDVSHVKRHYVMNPICGR